MTLHNILSHLDKSINHARLQKMIDQAQEFRAQRDRNIQNNNFELMIPILVHEISLVKKCSRITKLTRWKNKIPDHENLVELLTKLHPSVKSLLQNLIGQKGAAEKNDMQTIRNLRAEEERLTETLKAIIQQHFPSRRLFLKAGIAAAALIALGLDNELFAEETRQLIMFKTPLKFLVTTKSGVLVRDIPNKKSKRLGAVAKGKPITAIGRVIAPEYTWLNITSPQKGFVVESKQNKWFYVKAINEPERSQYIIYIIKKDDTLSAIAVEYGTTWQELVRINSKTNLRILKIGQKIWVPNKILIQKQGKPLIRQQKSKIEYSTTDTTFKSDPDDILLARLLYGEARGVSDKEKEWVAHTVINRVKSNLFPNSLKEVMLKKGAYSCFKGHNKAHRENRAIIMNPAYFEKKRPQSRGIFVRCLIIARKTIANTSSDPTSGANLYHAKNMKRYPAWTKPKVPTKKDVTYRAAYAVVRPRNFNHIFYKEAVYRS
jgi:LysM repeat protein